MQYLRLASAFVFLSVGLIVVGSYAQLPGDPAGPRPGTVYELAVAWSGPDTLERLADGGYNVDHVQPGVRAMVYATPEERAQLVADGFVVEEVAKQPLSFPKTREPKGLGTYSTYVSLTSDLQAYAAAHPDIARLYSLGESVQGRDIWALLITDNPDIEEAEPEFKYVSTMHGDEPVGTELCLYLIDRLLNDYGVDGRVTDLVDETSIWIVPLMNPDGLEAGTRNSANGFDLNRSFPTYASDFVTTFYDGEPLGAEGRQPEVRHIMEWTAENSFVLSANLHTGALVVNYPYDYDVGIPTGVDAPSPDDVLFEDVSLRYSMHNLPMFNNFLFDDGITNGSAWFSITGGMQDWNYRFMGCNAVLVELSNAKTPPESSLPSLWADNEESMLTYLEAVHDGVRGLVLSASNGDPVHAKITVAGNTQPAFSDPDVGDYYRMLLPGAYTLTFEAAGFYPETVDVVVPPTGSAVADVQLDAIGFGFDRWAVLVLALSVAVVAVRLRPAERGRI